MSSQHFSTPLRVPIIEFYRRRVLPALYERLDEVFPEFGWVRDADGGRWRATREFFVRETFCAPAHRVEAFRCAAFGFSICDSQGFVPWTSYINAGRASSAWDIVEAVQTLAGRLGLVERLERRIPAEEQAQRRRRELLEAAVSHCCQRLQFSPELRFKAAKSRGLHPMVWRRGVALGVLDDPEALAQWLHALGFSQAELEASGLFADPDAWRGRLIVPWRNRWGTLSTLLAVRLEADPGDRADTLRLPSPNPQPAFAGHDVAIRQPGRGEWIIVQGTVEPFWLHALGWPRTIGLADGELDPARWRRLARWGVRHVVLLLDDDETGSQRLFDALRHRASCDGAPEARVIPLDAPGMTLGQVMLDEGGMPTDLAEAINL